jgi:pimeloyl-ACP methyl ester carboxylesterase
LVAPNLTVQPLDVVTLADGRPLSGLVAAVPEPRSTIVAVHGALARASYFHGRAHPDQSLFTIGNRLGHTVLALDRPGYGASARLVDDLSDAGRAELYRTAIGQLLAEQPSRAPIVVVSHSLGGAAAARLVTGDLPRLAGWELCASGLRPRETDLVSEEGGVLRDRITGRSLRDLVWGPRTLYPPGGMDTGARRADRPRTESGDAENWLADLPGLAAQVTVPVRLTMGARDDLWDHTPDAMEELAAAFTAAPRVVTNIQAGAPHNMSLAHVARAYHLGVLAFVEDCLTALDC